MTSPLVLKIQSNFGAFNNPESNVGGLMSYKIPTKTAVQGFLGAVLGLNLSETVELFGSLKYTAEPEFDFDSVNITYNSHYGGRKGRMVNVQQELLIDPKYKLYLDFSEIELKDSEIKQKVKNNFPNLSLGESIKKIVSKILRKKQNYYTPYMGKREFPLEYKLVDFKLSKIIKVDNKDKFKVEAAIPRKILKNYQVEKMTDKKEEGLFGDMTASDEENFEIFHINRIPMKQDSNRNFESFEDLVLKKPQSNSILEVALDKNKLESYNLYLQDDQLIVCF